jgi:hypothetical protein
MVTRVSAANPWDERLNNVRRPVGATRVPRVAPTGLHNSVAWESQGFHPWLPSAAAPRLEKASAPAVKRSHNALSTSQIRRPPIRHLPRAHARARRLLATVQQLPIPEFRD